MTTATDSFVDDLFRELKGYIADEFQARFDAFARSIDDRIKALPVLQVKGEAGRDGPTREQVAEMVKAEAAQAPRPRDGIDGKSVNLDEIKSLVDLAFKALPVPKDGKDGAPGLNGKDGALGAPGQDGRPGDRGEPGERGQDGEKGLPGDRGEKGEPGLMGKDGAPGRDGLKGDPGDRGEKGEPGIQGKAGSNGLDGKDGAPGLNGKDGANGINGKDGAPGLNGKDGAPGVDGQKGLDGKNGTSVTLDDMRPILEGEVAKWALDFERRAGDVLQKAIDRMPVARDGKDGANGRDGADALGFDDVYVEKTSDRTVAIVFKNGAREKRHEITFPVFLDAGVFKMGECYEPGDALTYGGSLFVAQRNTLPTEKPEDGSGAFRLAVKRGRDGGGS